MVLVEADRGELLLRLDSRGRGGEAVMGGRLRWRQWAEGCGDGGGGGGESSSNGTTEDAEPRTKCPETPVQLPAVVDSG
jgi:hypothetical protein